MKRDPNSDIPGFEGEYYGTVGREKKHHQTHFGGLDVPWVRTPIDQDPNYVRIGPGRYKYVGRKRNVAGERSLEV